MLNPHVNANVALALDLAYHLGFPSPDALRDSLTEDEWAAWCRWWGS